MLKRLLLTAALLSSTYGTDATLIAEEINSESTHVTPITIVDSAHSQENITTLLNALRSMLTQPAVKPEDITFAIGELSNRISILNFSCKDLEVGSIDNFNFSFTLETSSSEIKDFIQQFSSVLLPALFASYNKDFENQWNIYTNRSGSEHYL